MHVCCMWEPGLWPWDNFSLGGGEWKFVPGGTALRGFLHCEGGCSAQLWGSGRGNGGFFVFQGIRDTEKIFRRQVSLGTSFPRGSRGAQRVLMALYSWKFSSSFLLILEIGKN